MNGSMVTPAQQGEIVQGRRSTIGPVANVMAVAPACGAAGKLTPPMARFQRASNGRGDRSSLAPYIEHRAIVSMLHDDEGSVARDAP